MSQRASLTVAGSGIRGIEQMTLETVMHVREADKLLLLVPAGPAERWILAQNTSAESLRPFYARARDRLSSYLDMAEYVVSFVKQDLRVCLIAYGHPGVFAMPTHLAVRLARQQGYPATMLPGVSADACLTADLGVDPGQGGCRSFEATDFLARGRSLDPASQLVLWQIGIIGMFDSVAGFDAEPGLRALTARLMMAYPDDHPVTVYEASTLPGRPPRIEQVPLAQLPTVATTSISTLHVPATTLPELDDLVLADLGVDAGTRLARRQSDRRRADLLKNA